MAAIVFVVLPLAGSVYASLKLARDLQARGHAVSYLGLPDSEADVTRNGFAFAPVFSAWFPPGFNEEHERLATLGLAELWPAARAMTRRFNQFVQALLNGQERSFHAAIATLKPDLMLFVNSGETMTIPALLAHAAGIKSIYLYDMLCRGEDLAIPPVSSPRVPENTFLSRLGIAWAWRQLRLRQAALNKPLVWLGLQLDWPKLIGALAEHCGYPRQQIQWFTDTATFRLKLPELVLFPEALEFPGAALPGRYYIEASIDHQRKPAPFPWDKLDATRPLGFCAIGTMSWLGREASLKFFRTVIAAAATRPGWQWVVAIGNTLDIADFDPPDHVILVKQAPQLDLLKRAALMINHGGANTVKECAYFGVPMILLPLVNDTPGMAARAAYHGLGLKADLPRLDKDTLGGLIEQIKRSSHISLQTRLMREKFCQAEQAGQGVRLIETLLDDAAKTPET